MPKLILKYALILFVALSLLKFLEFQFFSYKLNLESYLAVVATLFLVAGIIVTRFWSKWSSAKSKTEQNNVQQNGSSESPKTSSDIDPQLQQEAIELLSNISEREQQVLQLLCHGYTNKEIAGELFISLSTVKTHINNIYSDKWG